MHNKPAITLALGGGGVKCYAQIGVIQTLTEAGITIKGMAATSGGAVIAGLYALGKSPAEIISIIKQFDIQRLSRHTRYDRAALFGLHHWRPALEAVFGRLTFADLAVPLALPTVDVATRQQVVINAGPLVDAILAAAAIPGIYPTQSSAGRELMDGGVLTPVPAALARSLAPALPVVAVALIPPYDDWGAHPFPQLINTVPWLRLLGRLRFTQALANYVSAADLTNRMLAETLLQVDAPDFVIRPAVNHLGLFDKISIEEIVGLGEAASRAALPQILARWPGASTGFDCPNSAQRDNDHYSS